MSNEWIVSSFVIAVVLSFTLGHIRGMYWMDKRAEEHFRPMLDARAISLEKAYREKSELWVEKEKADKALMEIADTSGGFYFIPEDEEEDNCDICQDMIGIAQKALKEIKY